MVNVVKGFILLILLGISCVSNGISKNEAISAGTNKSATLIDIFVDEFQKRNKKIDTAEVLALSRAISSKLRGYIVVARGTREGQRNFEGIWEDELFGVFIIDQRLGAILHTLDMFPTQRWYDYKVSIYKIEWNFVTIKGEGDMYGDSSFLRKFDLSVIPPRISKAPKKPQIK